MTTIRKHIYSCFSLLGQHQSTLKAVMGIACQGRDLLDISKGILVSPVSISVGFHVHFINFMYFFFLSHF